MTSPYYGLERSAGFLMGTTYRKLTNLLHNRLKPYDITPEQWSVLYQIDQVDGLIQKEIGERAGKDKPTTTRILDHLEMKGLIYKQMGTEDRRSLSVYITEKGKNLMQATTRIERQVIEEVKQCMTEEEYDVLISLLLRINRFVNECPDN